VTLRGTEPPPGFPITSQIEGELRELRVRFANTRFRILYRHSENLVILVHALEKDTEAVPRSDIELAEQRMADFKRRMNAARPRRAASDRHRAHESRGRTRARDRSDAAVPKGAWRWIESAQYCLLRQGAHRALSAIDLLICATAAQHGLVVLHDDNDFVTAATYLPGLRERSIHNTPEAH